MSGITVYTDLVLPDEVVGAGVVGAQSRQNDRGRNIGGFDSINVLRDLTLRYYQIGIVPMETALWRVIEAIFEDTDAGAFGFLMTDPKDARVRAGEGALMGYMSGVQSGVSGYGNGCPTYALQKRYPSPGNSRVRLRDILRPNGAPAITRGGSPVAIGAGAGNVSLSAGPVYVTFVPDATRTVSSVTAGATTQVVLSSAISGLVASTGKLWLQDLAGADAALLNGKAHTITAIAGATYTLATNTAGKTITTGSGQGHKYPQPDEVLAWTGAFYVPVHFRDDELDWEMVATDSNEDYRLVRGPAIWLDEVREA